MDTLTDYLNWILAKSNVHDLATCWTRGRGWYSYRASLLKLC